MVSLELRSSYVILHQIRLSGTILEVKINLDCLKSRKFTLYMGLQRIIATSNLCSYLAVHIPSEHPFTPTQ